ncbi:carboxypeptidase y inhibitor [Diaporthe amygdali]|uniref:carboxypeptidase y inhibitor n=1 Tax=Phomopsis amygdali TaxID=1214568 RepID=UPI0022FF0783|nr:carboxypeptidase y inhibitor [Diaporthe amygdali]KAJ0120709.1 carboxypeptidase y inhibitor [Diaporthe amygdali]
MSTIQNINKKLQEHQVVPDVLPAGLDFQSSLTLKWPNTILDAPGKELDREETQLEPKLYLKPPPSQNRDDYVLIMTDPDLMADNDANFGQVRHWLATSVSTKDGGELVISSESNVSSYVGPAPLPNYISPRPHRYTFILARPSAASGKVEINPDDLRELQKAYPAALSGKQQPEVQDLKDRWGFNAYQLIKNKDLQVEAATFMKVGGTLKSTAANIGLTGEAVVNKIIGN